MAEATPTVEAASTKLSDVKEAAKSKSAVKRETEARKRKTQSKLPINHLHIAVAAHYVCPEEKEAVLYYGFISAVQDEEATATFEHGADETLSLEEVPGPTRHYHKSPDSFVKLPDSHRPAKPLPSTATVAAHSLARTYRRNSPARCTTAK